MALVKCEECLREVSAQAKKCPGCGSKMPVNRNAWPPLAGAVVVVLLLVMCTGKKEPEPDGPAVQARLQQSLGDRARSACERERATQIESYEALRKQRQFWEASLAFKDCPDLLADGELKGKVRAAQVEHYLANARDTKASVAARGQAIAKLQSLDATAIPPAEQKTFAELQARALRIEKAEDAKRLAALKAERRKRGVSIGMTQEEVVQSSWGRPRDVNRSTYASGTHEQWVYGGGNYLYFENGILTAIQN